MSEGRADLLDRARSGSAGGSEPVYFDRWDALAILAFTVVAFVFRFYSPIMPDFFLHPFQGPVISNCVSPTPIDVNGDSGTLCGLVAQPVIQVPLLAPEPLYLRRPDAREPGAPKRVTPCLPGGTTPPDPPVRQ